MSDDYADNAGIRNKFIKYSILFWIGFPIFFLGFAVSNLFPLFFGFGGGTVAAFIGWGIMGFPKILAGMTRGFGAVFASPLSDYEVVTKDQYGNVKSSDGGTESATMNIALRGLLAIVIFFIGGLIALVHLAVMTIKCFSKQIALPIVVMNIAVIIAVFIATGILQSTTGASEQTKKEIKKTGSYKFVENIGGGSVTLTEYTGIKGGALTFPAEINGLPVTKIEGQSRMITVLFERFQKSSRTNVSSLVIPDTVTHISNITRECIDLKQVTLSNNLKIIGEYSFQSSGITSLVIPEGVIEIGKYAFYQCKDLTSITLPRSLERIEDSAFADCILLKDVVIPAGTNITYGKDVFKYSVSLSSESKEAITNSGFKGTFNIAQSTTVKRSTTLWRIGNFDTGSVIRGKISKGATVLKSEGRGGAFILVIYEGVTGWVDNNDLTNR